MLVAALVSLAALARVVGLHERTGDMVIFETWYQHLAAAGGWRGLGDNIGNYNAPFLYILAVTIYLPGPLIVKIKAVWLIFDVLLAFFTYKIVAWRWPGRRVATVAALVMLMLPTVVINASFYGQMDAMWASFALGGLYFLLRDRPWWGVSLCTVALAIKPQGIFIFPLVLLLVLAGRIPWRSLLAAPAVFVGLDLPAIALGRHPLELLTIYSLGRQGSHVPMLSQHAPSVYAFIPTAGNRVESVRMLGYIFAATLVLGICYVLVVRGVALTRERIVTAATLFAILLPFTLPGMHERYFFLADVLSVVLVFFRPRLWFVPMLVEAASLMSYETYLFGHSTLMLPMVVPATLMLAALITVGYFLLRDAALPAAGDTTPPATSVPVEAPATIAAPVTMTAPVTIAAKHAPNGKKPVTVAHGEAVATAAAP